MRKTLNSAGVTVVETLAATAILVLLALVLGSGLHMTVDAYQGITAKSELELLMSTALDALADDLRFASAVSLGKGPDTPAEGYEKDCCNFNYASDSFAGKRFRLGLNEYGQIVACNNNGEGTVQPFLPSGAYGAEGTDGHRAYKVEAMNIEYKNGLFYISLTVQSAANTSIKATGNLTVRCLNPEKQPVSTPAPDFNNVT